MEHAKLKMDGSLVSIISTPLRIREDKALPILTAYNSFMQAANGGEMEKQAEANKEENLVRVYAVKDNGLEKAEDFQSSFKMRGRGMDAVKNASAGSILVVPVRGVMMRESSYSWRHGYVTGTRDLEHVVRAAERSPNIEAIVFQLKSPGGEAAGNESLARTINSCSIPTLVSFEGMASAALEAFIGVTEIYALEKDSYFGSLGTRGTVVDDSEYWANMGVKFIDIKAPQSSLKNFETDEALKGNTEPMEERLEKSTVFFIDDVKAARPQIKDDGRIFKGAIYNAVEALAINAIDGIKDFDFVINRAAYLSRKAKRNNKSKSNDMDDKTKKTEKVVIPAVEKVVTPTPATPPVVEEKVTVEMDEQTKSAFDRFKTFIGLEKSEKKEETKDENAVAIANQEVARLKALVGVHEKSIQELTSEKSVLSDKVKGYETDFAELSKAKTLKDEEPFEDVKAMVEAYNKTFDHNIELGGKGKSPNLPVGKEESVEGIQKTQTPQVAKTADEMKKEIEGRIAAKKKAKEEAKKESE